MKKQFNPPLELIQFAEWFSKHYHILHPGTYRSENGEYRIDYEHVLKDPVSKVFLKTPARVSQERGIIEIDKNKITAQEYSQNFVFFLILWCRCMYEQKEIYIADELAVKYYMEQGRPKNTLLDGYGKMFDMVPSQLNITRMTKIVSLIVE
jgi:hypothetical protein